MEIERHKIFKDLSSRLGLYSGIIFQLKNHFQDAVRIRKNAKRPTISFYMGSNLVFKNHLIGNYEFIHTYTVNSRNLVKTVVNAQMQFSNFCVAQSFEAFETFLKDLVALKATKNRVLAKRIEPRLDLKSFNSCRESLIHICCKNNRNNKQLFKLINAFSSKRDSKIQTIVDQLAEWYIVFSEIRHAVVHSDGKIDEAKMENWTKYQKGIFKEYFQNRKKDTKFSIDSSPNYKTIITTVAMHAQLLYDGLEIKLMKGSR
jgi:hypothetical protein